MTEEKLPQDDISIDDPNKQRLVFIITVIVVLLGVSLMFGIWYIFYSRSTAEVKGAATTDERNAAIQRAYEVYDEYKQAGLNMEKGPCLTNELLDNWVLDIAHDPREDIDNEFTNQCKDYVHGKKEHFVELTPEGVLIRAM